MNKSIKILLGHYFALLGLVSTLNAQNSTDIDSIYKQILFNNIEVLDTNWNVVSNRELHDLIYFTDTVCLFSPQNDYYLNTSFISGSIFPVRIPRNIILISNKVNPNYLSYIHRVFDEDTGLFKWEVEKFRIKKSDLKIRKRDTQSLDSLIFNNILTAWKIDSIHYHNRFFKLDSCHQEYKLQLYSNGKFKQYFGLKDSFCNVEVDSSFMISNFYFNKYIEHKNSVIQGYWKVKDGRLYLFESGKQIFEVDYKIEGQTITLVFNKNDYTKLTRKGI